MRRKSPLLAEARLVLEKQADLLAGMGLQDLLQAFAKARLKAS
jgi:hypothetical protein